MGVRKQIVTVKNPFMANQLKYSKLAENYRETVRKYSPEQCLKQDLVLSIWCQTPILVPL